jgi:CDP-diglyceride synthetase
MDVKSEFTARAISTYLVALAVGGVLTGFVWGLTGGVIGSFTISHNPEYRQKINSFLLERGIDPASDSGFQKLSKDDREAFVKMTNEMLSDVNWFFVTLFVGVVTFGLVGFIGGLFARGWVLAGAVIPLSFLIYNPLLRFEKTEKLSVLEIGTILFTQFAVCLFLAFCGARLTWKRIQKKL